MGKDLSVWGNSTLETMNLPALRTVGGRLFVSYPMASLGLPVLESVGGDLTISGTELETLSLPALTSVGGELDISSNRGLCQSQVDDLISRLTAGGTKKKTRNCCNKDGC